MLCIFRISNAMKSIEILLHPAVSITKIMIGILLI